MDLSPIGWITLIGVVLIIASVPLGQARSGTPTHNLANAMTLIGALGLLIGLGAWMFGG